MSRLIFPYGIRFQEDGKLDVFPAAEIIILGKSGEGIRTMFHIDSGATTSILPLSDAEVLGIKAETGRKMTVRGFAGETNYGYRQIIQAMLNDMRIKIPVIFMPFAVPRILGRERIFSKFMIIFDESKSRTGLFAGGHERKIVDSIFTAR